MTAERFQSMLVDRLDRMDEKLDQHGIDIAKIQQHLANNVEQKNMDWQRKVIYAGWFLTLIGLTISVIVAIRK